MPLKNIFTGSMILTWPSCILSRDLCSDGNIIHRCKGFHNHQLMTGLSEPAMIGLKSTSLCLSTSTVSTKAKILGEKHHFLVSWFYSSSKKLIWGSFMTEQVLANCSCPLSLSWFNLSHQLILGWGRKSAGFLNYCAGSHEYSRTQPCFMVLNMYISCYKQ